MYMPKKGKPKETAAQAHKRRIHSITAKALGFTDAQYAEYKGILEKIQEAQLRATPGKEWTAWNELLKYAADPLLHKKIQMSGKKEATTRRAFGIRGLPFPEEVIKNIAEKGRLTALEFLNTIKTRMDEIETIAKQSSSSEQSNLTNSGQSYLTGSEGEGEGEISTPPPSPPSSSRKAQSTKPSGKKKPSKNKSPKKKPTKRKKPRRQRRRSRARK